MRLLFFGVAFFLVPYTLLANTAVDSLLTVYSSTYDSKIKANTAYKIARYYKRKNTDSSILYIDSAFFYASDSALIGDIYRLKADVFYKSRNHKKFLLHLDSALNFIQKDSIKALVFQTKGIFHKNAGNFSDSKMNFEHIFKLENIHLLQVALAIQGLATIAKETADFVRAVDLQFEAHEIFLSLNDSLKIAGSFNQIAILYKVQEDYDNALLYYNYAIEINSKIRNTSHKTYLSYNYNNIGNIYSKLENYDSSIFYHLKSLKIKKELNDQKSMVSSYLNLGRAYSKNKEYVKANEYLAKSEKMSFEYDSVNLSYVYLYYGEFYFIQNNYVKSKQYLLNAIKLSNRISNIENIMESADLLSKIYKIENNHKKALEMRNLNIKMKDSILDIENTRAIIRNQYQLMAKSDSTANALELELQQQKLKAKNTELEENERKLTYLSIAILLFLGLIVFIYSRLRVIRNQKEIIDGAFIQLEEKSNEIQDSIEYAKRIQKGISPSFELIRDFFPESFVFYQPKSVVAGDFFWVKKINNNLLFAVGDCTGHGVPGAMVSVLCQSILNRVVADFKFFDPSKILDEARKLIVEHLDYGNEVIHDGMDIALCSFDTSTSKMQFAGANNPLWVVRNNELLEFKGDHQPVGYFQKSKNFTNNTLQVKKGDMVFVFSDGFSDQFGGEKGKKYKLGNFKKFILSINENNFPSYSTELEREFNQWKGDNEQVDDVCILGIKF